MKQFTLNLDKKQQRPVVMLNNLSALLDTGAYIPVWTDDEEILVSGLGGTLVKKGVPFTGFGGVAYGNLYQVTIKVGDLIFPNMHIVANSELNNSYNLILSATMFDGLIYEINTKTHKLNITVPNGESNVRNLRIEDVCFNGGVALKEVFVLCKRPGEEAGEYAGRRLVVLILLDLLKIRVL